MRFSRARHAILVFVFLLALLAPPGRGATISAAPASARQGISMAALAQKLANGILHAHSQTARYRALLQIMRTISFGVYASRTGTTIVHGAERQTKDFYLYDVEVTAMAQELGAGKTFGLQDIIALLTQVGAIDPQTPLAPADLQQLLQIGVQTSQANLHAPGSLVPLLVRDLGLHHTPAYDLGTALTPDQIQLDALQLFLVEADLLVPTIRKAVGGKREVLQSRSVLRGPCPQVKEEPEGHEQLGDKALEWWGAKKWGEAVDKLKSLSSKLQKALAVKELLDQIIEGLHGATLAAAIAVTPNPNGESLKTHYGPPGHEGAPANAGQPIKFQVKVEMTVDLGEEKIDCLALAGIKLPKKGPIPDVPVLWEVTAQTDLRQYGTFDPAPGVLGSETTTGKEGPEKGIATLVFTPNNEKFPGMGMVIVDTGVVDGIVKWGTAFENTLGKVNELFTPIYTGMRWEVGYHKPSGFKLVFNFRGWVDESFETQLPPPNTDPADADPHDGYGDFQLTASVCGPDPHQQPWEFTLTEVGHDTSDKELNDTYTFPAWTDTLDPSGTFGSYSISIPGTGPVPVSVSADVSSAHPTGTLKPLPFWRLSYDTPTVTAPVQNNGSCPAPPAGPPQLALLRDQEQVAELQSSLARLDARLDRATHDGMALQHALAAISHHAAPGSQSSMALDRVSAEEQAAWKAVEEMGEQRAATGLMASFAQGALESALRRARGGTWIMNALAGR